MIENFPFLKELVDGLVNITIIEEESNYASDEIFFGHEVHIINERKSTGCETCGYGAFEFIKASINNKYIIEINIDDDFGQYAPELLNDILKAGISKTFRLLEGLKEIDNSEEFYLLDVDEFEKELENQLEAIEKIIASNVKEEEVDCFLFDNDYYFINNDLIKFFINHYYIKKED